MIRTFHPVGSSCNIGVYSNLEEICVSFSRKKCSSRSDKSFRSLSEQETRCLTQLASWLVVTILSKIVNFLSVGGSRLCR